MKRTLFAPRCLQTNAHPCRSMDATDWTAAGNAATCETLYNLEHKEHSAVFRTARGAVQTRREARKLGVMNIYDSVHIGMQLERRWVGSGGLRNARHGDSLALARSAVPHVAQGRQRRRASVAVWSRKPSRSGQENRRGLVKKTSASKVSKLYRISNVAVWTGGWGHS